MWEVGAEAQRGGRRGPLYLQVHDLTTNVQLTLLCTFSVLIYYTYFMLSSTLTKIILGKRSVKDMMHYDFKVDHPIKSCLVVARNRL